MAYQKGKVSILASLRNVGLFLSTLIADTQRFSKGSIGGPITELEKHYGKLNLDVLSVTWYRMLEEHGKTTYQEGYYA